MGKGKNWVPDEDTQLCRSWLFVSGDPGASKSAKVFWKLVSDHFNANNPAAVTPQPRPLRSVQSRFSIIKFDVSKFCIDFDTVKAKPNNSNKSTEELVKDALNLYRNSHPKKQPFGFLACWRVLHDQPQWLNLLAEGEPAPDGSRKVRTGRPGRPPKSLTASATPATAAQSNLSYAENSESEEEEEDYGVTERNVRRQDGRATNVNAALRATQEIASASHTLNHLIERGNDEVLTVAKRKARALEDQVQLSYFLIREEEVTPDAWRFILMKRARFAADAQRDTPGMGPRFAIA